MALPKRIYKYRAFSGRVLDMLVEDELYFADPSDFNDPLDSRPYLEADLPAEELRDVLSRMIELRVRSEMLAAAKAISYRGPRTIEHIERLSRSRAAAVLADVEYNAGNPDYDGVADPQSFLLRSYLEGELLRRYDRGIVSFGSQATSPLMWSHYGDQHRGVCAGYSIPAEAVDGLKMIWYGGSRVVKASDVAKMDRDAEARRKVDEAVLLHKAAGWRYEREWRLIGNRGAQPSPLELEEVIFGLRCTISVQYAIVRALEGRGRTVRFYEMRETEGSFRLRKVQVEVGELLATLPRRSRDVHDAFDNLDQLDASSAAIELPSERETDSESPKAIGMGIAEQG